MATIPLQTTPSSIEPPFIRRQQANDFDCWTACIATVAGKSLEEVRAVAVENFGLPAHGPYWYSENLIAKIFAHFGFVSSIYKEVTSHTHLPDCCLLLIDYDTETEVGRHVVFFRDKRQKPAIEAVIDVAYWIDDALHIRTDLKTLKPSFYISVHPMAGPTAPASAARSLKSG